MAGAKTASRGEREYLFSVVNDRPTVSGAVLALKVGALHKTGGIRNRGPVFKGPLGVVYTRGMFIARDFTPNRPVQASHRRWVHVVLQQRRQEIPVGHIDQTWISVRAVSAVFLGVTAVTGGARNRHAGSFLFFGGPLGIISLHAF